MAPLDLLAAVLVTLTVVRVARTLWPVLVLHYEAVTQEWDPRDVHRQPDFRLDA